MINILFGNGLRFIAFILMQVLVINNLGLSFYINPYLYPFLLMMLPFTIPHWLLIVIGFFTGLTVDAFCNTMGMHAAACTFMTAMRPIVLRFLTPKGSYESLDQPRVQSLGYGWFIAYTGTLTLLHHFFYFYIEVFSMDNFFLTFAKTLASAIVSTVLIFLTALIFAPGKSRG
ncbi:MAG: hypothetical protein SH857_18950 [Chitinophagales bacterium]|nr:hypothetical protein [Chitinophagales bacterium]